jgi:TonB family C-terminal domain
MKRNEKKVPGFDEIIFRNRNREYGAYDLRRRYKSAASFSILGVSAFFILLIMLISSFMPKDATAGTGPIIIVSAKPEKYVNPEKIVQPEVKRPAIQPEVPRYVPPVISDDSTLTGNTIMTNDLAVLTIKDGDMTENIDSAMKIIAPEPVNNKDEIIITSQEPPIFPGGPEALLKYIAENTKYPQEAIDINMQGKVIVKFAVMYDGSVSRLEVLRGVCPLLDNEAIRVVSTIPKWRPGKQNGNPVSVWFMVPVTFQIR